MFSAVFMPKFAEGADKDAFDANVKDAAAAVSDVNLCTPVGDPPMPGGDYFCELGFKDQDAYEAAKATDAYKTLAALFKTGAEVASCEFVAFGEGTLTLQDKENSICHRLLIFSIVDGAKPEMIKKMEEHMNGMTKHVPGLRNCKFAKIVECSGTDEWAYAYECDFDSPETFFGKYMSTPYHVCYIDKFFEPACDEWVANVNLQTPYMLQEKPFLANYAD